MSNQLPISSQGWEIAELTETAVSEAGPGLDQDLPALLRFETNAAKLLKRRLETSAASIGSSLPTVLLLVPSPTDDLKSKGLRRLPLLGSKHRQLGGTVCFVAEAVRSGYVLESGIDDDAALFEFIINELGQIGIPAVVYDPSDCEEVARFYEKGIQEYDVFKELSLKTNVSLDYAFDAIEGVYRNCLMTPDAQPAGRKLWLDNTKWIPIRDAELVVQAELKSGLAGRFPTCYIRAEQPGPLGRLDLEIEEHGEQGSGASIRHVLLELKVLRSFGVKGGVYTKAKIRAAVMSGVRQAAAYRDERNAKVAALCCFDMRRETPDDDCFAHVAEEASALSVSLRKWFLFASSDQARVVKYPMGQSFAAQAATR